MIAQLSAPFPSTEDVRIHSLCSFLWLDVVWNSTRQDVVLPLSTPIKGMDGREISEVFIPNNTNVIVGILAANRNPEVWGPDSYEWKPERWLTSLPDSVSAAHMPGIYSNLWVQLILLLLKNLVTTIMAYQNPEWLLLVVVGHACEWDRLFYAFLHVLTLKIYYTRGFKFSQLEMSKQLLTHSFYEVYLADFLLFFFFFIRC